MEDESLAVRRDLLVAHFRNQVDDGLPLVAAVHRQENRIFQLDPVWLGASDRKGLLVVRGLWLSPHRDGGDAPVG